MNFAHNPIADYLDLELFDVNECISIQDTSPMDEIIPVKWDVQIIAFVPDVAC